MVTIVEEITIVDITAGEMTIDTETEIEGAISGTAIGTEGERDGEMAAAGTMVDEGMTIETTSRAIDVAVGVGVREGDRAPLSK